MKRSLRSCFFLSLLTAGTASAQWCTPTGAAAYSVNMPGITNVTLNTINRTSAFIENSANNYTNTGLTTNLTKGQQYTISITHTRDAVIFPTVQNNIRVWIDYNVDGQLDDVGETVVSLDFQTFGTTTVNFTVPMSATTGNTRLRVTAKMSSQGGHTLPTPCNIPADPGGYHGELEDYTVNLITTFGLEEYNFISSLNVFPTPASYNNVIELEYAIASNGETAIELYNLSGQLVASLFNGEEVSGMHSHTFSFEGLSVTAGVYVIRLRAGSAVLTKRLILVN